MLHLLQAPGTALRRGCLRGGDEGLKGYHTVMPAPGRVRLWSDTAAWADSSGRQHICMLCMWVWGRVKCVYTHKDTQGPSYSRVCTHLATPQASSGNGPTSPQLEPWF